MDSLNSTNTTDTNNGTISLNTTNTNTDEAITDVEFFPLFFFFDSQWLQDLLNFLLQLIKAVISVPAARKIVTPLFYYFGNFDDLFLYSLHGREYGDAMNSLFEQISSIEAHKWSLISFG